MILVPRLNYDQGLKQKLGIWPQQQLGPGKIEDRNGRWLFQGEIYTGCGYLLLSNVDTAFYSPKPCFPTTDELNTFRECEEIPTHVFLAMVTQIASCTLCPGDKILIMAGDCVGLSGELCTITEDEAEVYLPGQDLVHSLPLRDIQRNFKSGDTVGVVVGIHKGIKGFVMTCADHVLSLYNPDTKNEVNISTWLLTVL